MNRDYVSRQFFPLNVFTIKGTLSLCASDIKVHIFYRHNFLNQNFSSQIQAHHELALS